MRLKEKFFPLYYTLPVILFYLVFLFYPIFFNVILSFFNWNGINPNIFKDFVAFENYKNLILDKVFWLAFRNTIYFVISTVIVQNLIGLFLAHILFFGNFKYGNILRSIIFFPTILSPVIVSLVWKKIFISDGLLNTILHLDIAWLGGLYAGIWIVAFVNIWQWSGYNMVLYYAGLQSLDYQLVEAAMIDGANWAGIVAKIVIPFLIPTITIASILTVLGGFKVFDLVYIMTKGGPAHQSEVITSYMYWLSFDATGPNRMGYAATVVIFSLFIAIVFASIRMRIMFTRKI
ncbi:MAG: sugar ABC transporter permease [Actinobacteria bacterium]|nr:sugar ABC transporter permease [Actinomycetota bacterium]